MDWRFPGHSGLHVYLYFNANLSFVPSFLFFKTRNQILFAAFRLPLTEEAEGATYPT